MCLGEEVGLKARRSSVGAAPQACRVVRHLVWLRSMIGRTQHSEQG